jgi:hypothetical protein
MNKKAQPTANGAANLISLITLVIVLYILFVPPDVRENLLGDGTTTEDSDTLVSNKLITWLIDKQPGKLAYLSRNSYEHNIPFFTLRESKFSNVLAEENPFQVKRSWFSNKNKEITFSIPSVKDTQSVKLAFSVNNPKGNLIISLNGYEFFNQEITNGAVNPIELPLGFLSNTNILEFKSSPTDLAFWKANSYDVNSLLMTGDFTDSSALDNSFRFYLENDEKVGEITKAWLLFSPQCNRNTVGKLSMSINGQSIYSAIPDCNSKNTVYFNPEILRDDENSISFSSAKGEYAMDLVYINTKIAEADYPSYYFELPASTYDKVESGDYYLNVSVLMPDDENFKEAYVLVNSVKLGYIDTRSNEFFRSIPKEVLQEGTNVVAIEPLNSFEMVSFKVGLYD